VGYIFDGASWASHSTFAWPSGGAGIALTFPAAAAIASRLYSSSCPFRDYNDVTIGGCADALRIPLVHHPGFEPEPHSYGVFKKQRIRSAVMAPATIHRVYPADMLALWALKQQTAEARVATHRSN
jgi:hypothetical protein